MITPHYLDSGVSEGALESWLELRANSPHTARAYRAAVRRFLEVVDRPLAELTPADLTKYLLDLRRRKLASASLAQHVSAVRSFLSFSRETGTITGLPLALLKSPRVEITSMTNVLTREQAERLLEAARADGPQAGLAVATLLSTGLRVRELTEAEWRDLFRDYHGNVGLHVRHAKGERRRVVLVQPHLLERFEEERRRLDLSPGLDPGDRTPLLPNPRGRRYSSSGIWKLVRRVASKAGIARPVSPHWLRHTFATLAATGGATVYELQRTLGHRQLSATQRYVNMANDLENSAARFVGFV